MFKVKLLKICFESLNFFFFFAFKNFLFIYFWLCWVYVAALSLSLVGRGGRLLSSCGP